jgi:hypothetical protein
MLDLNHPMTKHIFRAAALEDQLMENAKRMTLLPSEARLRLLADCQTLLDEMYRLSKEHFSNHLSIAPIIREFRSVLEQIAHAREGQIDTDHSDGEGPCPVCNSAFTKMDSYHKATSKEIFCHLCVEPFMKVRAQSERAFSTWAI